MKTKYFFIFLFISTFCSAQVGIGTTNPQKEFHVAGENSTIRIESLNSTNDSTFNDGIKPAPAYVNADGDLTLGNSFSGGLGPFNFLLDLHNFIPDNPYGWTEPDEINTTGYVLNSPLGQSTVEGEIISSTFTVPQEALIEVKYGVTLYIKGEDMSANPPPYADVTYGQTINMVAFFLIDIDNDGLSEEELGKRYGIKGQYFETQDGGNSGFPYMNGQAYFTLPVGTHKIYFYGKINDHEDNYTSVGFGGLPDYLKVRIYN